MKQADFDALIDTIHSLIGVMEEESGALATIGRCAGIAELAGAKTRLVDRLESMTALLQREEPEWLDGLDGEDADLLQAGVRSLRDAATVNADVLGRQIALTEEMMAVVGVEMQRQTGRRSEAYNAAGAVSLREVNAPLSINYRL